MKLPRLHVTQWLSLISGGVLLAGMLFIALYATSTAGTHVRFMTVGLLTAFAAFVVGCLFGFLFGIPKVVSSGAFRHTRDEKVPVTTTDDTPPTTTTTTAALPVDVATTLVKQGSGSAAASPAHEAPLTFEPSSNLAEVSDWLTKLLLGAGLVSLTKLGHPIGTLIDAVAGGLDGTCGAAAAGPARTVAGAILLMYTTLGFLDGYVVTTLWYGKRMNR